MRLITFEEAKEIVKKHDESPEESIKAYAEIVEMEVEVVEDADVFWKKYDRYADESLIHLANLELLNLVEEAKEKGGREF